MVLPVLAVLGYISAADGLVTLGSGLLGDGWHGIDYYLTGTDYQEKFFDWLFGADQAVEEGTAVVVPEAAYLVAGLLGVGLLLVTLAKRRRRKGRR